MTVPVPKPRVQAPEAGDIDAEACMSLPHWCMQSAIQSAIRRLHRPKRHPCTAETPRHAGTGGGRSQHESNHASSVHSRGSMWWNGLQQLTITAEAGTPTAIDII